MSWKEKQKERNEQCEERHALAVDRLRGIVSEDTVSEKYLPFFQDTAIFLLELENVRTRNCGCTFYPGKIPRMCVDSDRYT